MNDFTLADQDWNGQMILKNLRIRTDSILSDQDWTRSEKFHSPLIFAGRFKNFRSGPILKLRWPWNRSAGVESGKILQFSFGLGSGTGVKIL